MPISGETLDQVPQADFGAARIRRNAADNQDF
jgi:hypothetical protein